MDDYNFVRSVIRYQIIQIEKTMNLKGVVILFVFVEEEGRKIERRVERKRKQETNHDDNLRTDKEGN